MAARPTGSRRCCPNWKPTSTTRCTRTPGWSNRVKVHAQMIIENAADPYHVQYVHKAANPANTASFDVSGYHLHATVNANFGGGRAKTG